MVIIAAPNNSDAGIKECWNLYRIIIGKQTSAILVEGELKMEGITKVQWSLRETNFLIVTIFLGLLGGCTTFQKAQNSVIFDLDSASAYSVRNHLSKRPLGDHLMLLSFSGGGTRAAALSYGVMKELQNTTYVDRNGLKRNLLQEVDFISAVSGGSFTAAYYGAFGDKIFVDFNRVFLHQSVEKALFSKIFRTCTDKIGSNIKIK